MFNSFAAKEFENRLSNKFSFQLRVNVFFNKMKSKIQTSFV
jgi:hypothetical protein